MTFIFYVVLFEALMAINLQHMCFGLRKACQYLGGEKKEIQHWVQLLCGGGVLQSVHCKKPFISQLEHNPNRWIKRS